ncbi:hypothetical protein [Providencia burhodogranariea]|uniref:Uncharacterized protein n=1 Tax=Providencia burhodogranariea DSM 19968 TaxID=1141662 RepID=K8WXF4_9GAMM|nr:hypothetical protein [Providencia burhodogranariea]EKT64606.1 hypothetical protein OOA_02377 [Providencia burhodogranariea DSM 19968]
MKSCENQLGNIDNLIESTDNVNIEILTMIANQQKQVVLAMLGQNPELVIAGMLAASIEIYAQQIEKIYGWTQGGVEMFRFCLMLMFEELKKDGISAIELEDLFQLALLEIMVNADEYGLGGWYDKNKGHISHILESTGSGSHSLHEKGYSSAAEMAKWVSQLYDSLKKEGNIPPESFLGQIIAELDKMGGSKALSDQIINGWNDDYGWWIQPADNAGDPMINRATNLSPMLRLFILSSLLNEKSMTKEQVEIILTGSLDEMDKFIGAEFEVVKVEYESATLSWLVVNTNWKMDASKAHGGYHLDWRGNGISLTDLDNLYKEFPGRELSEDELEEINRIGDQVKMLQQTLKYWTQLCADEQLAMARNI